MPLLIRYDPLITPGSVDDHIVLNLDFAPTFAELAGKMAPRVEGRSLIPLFTLPDPPWRSDFAVEHSDPLDPPLPGYCAIRNERFLYSAYDTGEEELYDLGADPFEMENRARDEGYGETVAELRARTEELCPRPPNYTYPWDDPKTTITAAPHSATSSR